jgi:hypothetical protein
VTLSQQSAEQAKSRLWAIPRQSRLPASTKVRALQKPTTFVHHHDNHARPNHREYLIVIRSAITCLPTASN